MSENQTTADPDKKSQDDFFPSASDIVAIVSELNGQIFDKLGEEYDAFDATFNGSSSVVNFLGNRIWFSDEDERSYDEAEDSYEPLIDFLRRAALAEAAKIAEIVSLGALQAPAPALPENPQQGGDGL